MSSIRSVLASCLVLVLAACGDSGTGAGGSDSGGAGPTSTSGGAGGVGGEGASAQPGSGGTGGVGAAGGEGGAGGSVPLPNPCDCTSVVEIGSVQVPGVTETSGLAASVEHPGAVYLHEDSGSASVFYAMDLTGAPLAELSITNVTANDMEDIAVGPCPEGTCIFIADVGDNAEARDDYAIYRVPEPAAFTSTQVTATVISFSYEDGSNNCEAFVVEPVTGAMYLLTKTSDAPGLYRIDDVGGDAVATRLFDVPALDDNLFTAADVRPDGAGVLVRTYDSLFYYAGAGVEAALAATPCEVAAAEEQQGEAVAFIEGGLRYITVSEGEDAEIYASVCE